MSSLPLISHHLFVAAVRDKSWGSAIPWPAEVPVPAAELHSQEVPIEVIKLGRPLPLETSMPFEVLRRVRSR